MRLTQGYQWLASIRTTSKLTIGSCEVTVRPGSYQVQGLYAPFELGLAKGLLQRIEVLVGESTPAFERTRILGHTEIDDTEKVQIGDKEIGTDGWSGDHFEILGRYDSEGRLVRIDLDLDCADTRRDRDATLPKGTWKAQLLWGLQREFSSGQIFDLEAVYQRLEVELEDLRPRNSHITDTIRDVLQELESLGFVDFIDGRGTYRLLC